MASKPKFNPRIHDENPEWTKEMFARAKPAKDALPPEILAQFKNKGGRPKLDEAKEAIKLRLDPYVLKVYRRTGAGWQTRINDTLKRAAKRIEKEQKPARKAG